MKISNRTIGITFFVFLSIFLITHFVNFPGSVAYFKEVTNQKPLLDLQPEFSTEGVYDRLKSFGEDGRAAYLKLIPTIDFIFPLSAFLFLLILGRFAADKFKHPKYSRYYWMLPSSYLFMDFLENAIIIIILMNYPQQLNLPASLLGYISVTKRVLMISALLIPLIVLLLAALRNRKSHVSS